MLAIQITGSKIRIVSAKKRKGQVVLEVKEEREGLGGASGSAVLCLPSSKVYIASFDVPPARGKRLKEIIHNELERVIPEDCGDLLFAAKQVSRAKDRVTISVYAVRKDLIEGYLNQGLRITGITTLPMAVMADAHSKRGEKIVVLNASSEESSVTLFEGKVAVDEEVFASGLDPKELAMQACKFTKESGAKSILVVGGQEIMEALKCHKVSSVKILPWLSDSDLSFAGAASASLAGRKAFTGLAPGKNIGKAVVSCVRNKKSRKMMIKWGALVMAMILIPVIAFKIRDPLYKMFPPDTSPATSEDRAPLYRDVPGHHSYYDAIAWVKTSGLSEKYKNRLFEPDRIVTRYEFLKLIIDATAETDVSSVTDPSGFEDIPAESEMLPYVRYAKKLGIVSGGDRFRPNDPITFAEALKMSYETFEAKVPSASGAWFEPYRKHAKENGVLFISEVGMEIDVTHKDAVWMVWRLWRLRG